MSNPGARSLRNTETRKKKRAHAIPRTKVSRIQGNTPAVRKALKKQAAKVRNVMAKLSAHA